MIRHFQKLLGYWFLACTLAVALRAQSVRWEPAGGSLALNQVSELQLIFENCEPEGEPSIPATPGLELARTGSQMESTNIVNGSYSKSLIYGYQARPTVAARVSVPPFKVRTDKGLLTVAPASFDVGKAAAVGGSVPLDSIAKAVFHHPEEVWAGEVFSLVYQHDVVRRYFAQFGSGLNWNAGPLVCEDWSKYAIQEHLLNGEKQVYFTQNTRALLDKPGTYTLPQGTQLVNITTGVQTFGFFSSPSLEQFSINTDKSEIRVKPLPDGAPKSFAGAVGKFTLVSKVVPLNAQVGEPVTWTLTLEGTGNWPTINALPSREVSADFRTVQPQPKRTPKPGKIFEASLAEDVILIPTVAGDYTLGPVTWTYFDSEKGDYVTVTTPNHNVHVDAAAAKPSSGTPTPFLTSKADAPKAPPAPAAPAPVPGDDVQEAGQDRRPFSKTELWTLAVSPAVIIGFLWFVLATLKAKGNDPHRAARKAKAALPGVIQKIDTATDVTEKQRLLQAWQAEVATLHGFAKAAPSASQFPAGSPTATLWSEVEACLYRPSTGLAADWTTRALEAAKSASVPAFKISTVFQARHLLPFLALTLAFLAVPQVQAAPKPDPQQASRLYAKGDFAQAADLWRAQTVAEPANWAAHYNLALALAQKDQWPEAAAHASIAFAQNPSEPKVRQLVELTLPKAGFTPMILGELRRKSLSHDLATLLSVPDWQTVLLGASAALALAATLILLRVYRLIGRWAKYAFLSLATLALLALIPSVYSIQRYGQVGKPGAVITWQSGTLRSIPTDADVEQKTSPLAPGTVAEVDRVFMDWVRLEFANGQTGWVHREGIEPFWQAPMNR